MEKEKPSGNIVDLSVLKRLFKWVNPYKKQFYFLVFLTLALALAGPVRPWLIQQTIDNELALRDYQGLKNMIILL
ncbi:MAG: ABC transporter ATP-binding protein, partial [Cyclobacteriaceae bacterium]